MSAAQLAGEQRGELGPRVDAGADRGAALRQLPATAAWSTLKRAQSLSICARHPPNSWASVIGIASIRCVRPVLTTPPNSRARRSSTALKRRSACSRFSVEEQRRRDVNRGRHDVVAALAHVHVIVRMHRPAQATARQRRDDLVGVHVAAGAGTGLKHVHRKLVVESSVGHLESRGLDGRRELGRHVPQFRVRARRRTLDQSQGTDERARHAQAARRKILDRALRLGAPERGRGHIERTHAVTLDAIVCRRHRALLRRLAPVYGNIRVILSSSDGILGQVYSRHRPRRRSLASGRPLCRQAHGGSPRCSARRV